MVDAGDNLAYRSLPGAASFPTGFSVTCTRCGLYCHVVYFGENRGPLGIPNTGAANGLTTLMGVVLFVSSTG